MNNLRISSEELRNRAAKISTVSENIHKILNKMFATVDTINGTIWSGDTQNIYVTRFEELKEFLPTVFSIIDGLVEDLNNIATEYEKGEEIIAQYVQALQDDVMMFY